MIKAKALMLTRFVISIIYLISFLVLFLIDLIVVGNIVVASILTSTIILLFFVIEGLSFEVKFMLENRRFIVFAIVIWVIFEVIFIIVMIIYLLILNIIILTTSVMGVLGWNYSLSIKKKKKLLFSLYSLILYGVNVIYQFSSLIFEDYLTLRFSVLNIVLFCSILILILEYIMKRKGYLKYL